LFVLKSNWRTYHVMNLNFYYQNVRGIRSKTNEILQSIESNNYDIILFTETWLREGIFNREFFDERYKVFRRDRSPATSSKSDGGGVCIAIKNSSSYAIIPQPTWQATGTEDLWVTLKPHNATSNIHINLCYIPGEVRNDTFEVYTNNLAEYVNLAPQDTFIILGDFNVPSFGSVCTDIPLSAKASMLKDLMDVANLDQLSDVRSKRESKNLLDLVFSNRFIAIEACEDPISIVDNFHPPFTFCLPIDTPTIVPQKISFRNFKRAPWAELDEDLKKVNWELEFVADKTVDAMVDSFYRVINRLLDVHCPVKTFKTSKTFSWFSRETKSLLNKKRKFHAKWKTHRNNYDYDKFKEYRYKSCASIEKDFEAYNHNIENEIKLNPKSFWKFVNSKRSNGAGVADFVMLDGRIALTKQDAAELFAEHFSSVYEPSSASNPPQSQSNSDLNNWSDFTIPLSTISDKLQNLDTKKAVGPDKLPALLFYNCASSLSFPLFTIFNQSLRSGFFPTQWKIAHVTPIPKEGSAHDVKNYRPISKLSVPAKVFDSIMTDELFDRFKDIIVPQQHAFYRKRSTVTNLADHTEKLQRCVDRGSQTDVIYTDYAKAFDKIDHSILVNKLQTLGISGNLLTWFWSYIVGRSQRVQIGESLSNPITVSSSVAQGSHLGPMLFSLFLNDVADVLYDVDFGIFADDLKISKEINNQSDADDLQSALQRLQLYSKENGLTLNIMKCFVVSFSKRTTNLVKFPYTLDGNILERRNSIRDLGVVYDSKMSFNTHIETICGKAKRMLGFVMRVGRNFKDHLTVKTLYCALVRSNLEYASVIWNPHTSCQKQMIERVQHKFLRFISGNRLRYREGDNVHYHDIEESFRLDSLEHRRIFADVKFTIKSHNNQIDSQTFIHNFTTNNNQLTRSSDVFRPSRSRTDVGKYSIFNRLMSSFDTNGLSSWLNQSPSNYSVSSHIRAKLRQTTTEQI
jgi:Reverse transcriptase (RNA-dependent DNA polymerase)/Endonuclease-reverse transcriptase